MLKIFIEREDSLLPLLNRKILVFVKGVILASVVCLPTFPLYPFEFEWHLYSWRGRLFQERGHSLLRHRWRTPVLSLYTAGREMHHGAPL